MKRIASKNLLSAAMSVAIGMTAGAAHANFDGLYVGGGLALNKMTVKETLTSNLGRFDSYFGDNDHHAALNLNAGYGMSFGQFNVAAELSYQTGMGKTLNYSYSTPLGSESQEYKLKNPWAISILPGYKVGKDTLVYGRIGYIRAKGEYKLTVDDDSEIRSHTYKGRLLGIGVKHAVTPRLAGVLEYQAANFKKKTVYSESGVDWTYKPSANGVLLGLMYTF